MQKTDTQKGGVVTEHDLFRGLQQELSWLHLYWKVYRQSKPTVVVFIDGRSYFRFKWLLRAPTLAHRCHAHATSSACTVRR